MRTRFDPIRLHHAVWRAGDRQLADLIARAIRRDRALAARTNRLADRTLATLVALLGLDGPRSG